MNGTEDVAKWLNDNLSQLLSFPTPQDLIQYIMSIENERDIEDYLRTLLNFDDPSHKQFWHNYKIIRHFKKEDDLAESTPGQKKKKPKQKNGRSKKSAEKEIVNLMEKGKSDDTIKEGKKKKKDKFVNLYSAEGQGKDVILLKGRHVCECQAAKHRLVNNCMSCGRIVCAQEGSGPCLFCGKLVCSKEEQEFINANTAQSKKLYENLMDAGQPEGWEDAVKQRDRLLEYDRTTQRRTKVIDDEGEYYSASSVWLSDAERKKIQKKEEEERRRKHASRLEAKFTLDFAGRQVIEESPYGAEYYEDEEEEQFFEAEEESSSVVHPNVALKWRPEFVEGDNPKQFHNKKVNSQEKSRIQDRELLEMSDQGLCLSMHQPWASLLVHGIKRHEGRTWYSSHRGRLWIAAAAKPPNQQEIEELENLHRLLRNDDNLVMPRNYPTSCLLGCVTLVDVLSQEQYQALYDQPESESPFVFICEDFRPLSLKFPMQGKHKIYKLDANIHNAAQKALLREARVDG